MPTNLSSLLGRINDLDSHEMVPACLWAEEYGPAGGMVASMIPSDTDQALLQNGVQVTADELPIDHETMWGRPGWGSEGPRAPGAIDMHRRMESGAPAHSRTSCPGRSRSPGATFQRTS